MVCNDDDYHEYTNKVEIDMKVKWDFATISNNILIKNVNYYHQRHLKNIYLLLRTQN